MLKKFIAVLLVLTLVCTVNVSALTINMEPSLSRTSYRGTLFVGGSGSGNYSSIQAAVDAASNGDTVFVYDDSSPYLENVQIISKSINLIGEDKASTMIYGGSGSALAIHANNMIIEGFTFENNGLNDGFRIDSCGSLVIQDNIIEICRSGLYLYQVSNSIIRNNTIRSNLNNGMLIYYSSNNIIEENNISSNGKNGIVIISSYHTDNNATISKNLFMNNAQSGILVQSSYNTIVENIFINNGNAGVSLSEGESEYTDYNEVLKNHFLNNEYGIYISSISYPPGLSCTDNLMYHNNFINNTINAYDEDSNIWDNGYSTPFNLLTDGGNYWDDYIGSDEFSGPGQNITGSDGIGDTQYAITGGSNRDYYPLMNPIDDTESPHVELLSPKKDFLYILNREIRPFFTTLVIFKIDVQVYASDYLSGIDKVEFYIDDVLKDTLNSEPYLWTWNEREFSRHTIKVVAYDKFGNTATAERDALKIF